MQDLAGLLRADAFGDLAGCLGSLLRDARLVGICRGTHMRGRDTRDQAASALSDFAARAGRLLEVSVC